MLPRHPFKDIASSIWMFINLICYLSLETRLDPLRLQKTFINLGFDAFEYLENRGYVGGICVVWKKNKMDVVVHKTHF